MEKKKETFFTKSFTTNWGEVIKYGLIILGIVSSFFAVYYAFIDMREDVDKNTQHIEAIMGISGGGSDNTNEPTKSSAEKE